MSREMPVECAHGRLINGGDFVEDEYCPECADEETRWREEQQADQDERFPPLDDIQAREF